MTKIPKLNECAIAFLILMASFIAISIVAVLGTSLPDLLCIMDTDLKSASFILFSFGIGKCLVPLVGIIVNRSVDWDFLSAIALGATSVSLAVTPFSGVLSVTVFLYGVIGICTGMVEIARFYIAGVVWETSNFGYHFMSIGTGLGTVMTPVIASIFVKNKHNTPELDDHQQTLSAMMCESNIYLSFALLSLITICTGLGFAMNYYSLIKNDIALYKPLHNKDLLRVSNFTETCFNILLMLFVMTITGCMTSVYSLMVTYGLRSKAHLEIATSTAMMSVFGICLLISRMFCTCIADLVKPRTILWVCLILLTTASLNLLVFKDTSTMMLWICSALHGLGAGPLIATVITWSRQYVTLSPRLVSVMLLLDNVGNVAHSTLTGIFMDYFGPDMFVYTIASTRFLQLIIFCVLNLLIWRK